MLIHSQTRWANIMPAHTFVWFLCDAKVLTQCWVYCWASVAEGGTAFRSTGTMSRPCWGSVNAIMSGTESRMKTPTINEGSHKYSASYWPLFANQIAVTAFFKSDQLLLFAFWPRHAKRCNFCLYNQAVTAVCFSNMILGTVVATWLVRKIVRMKSMCL